eukprot:COSAG05_NODE_66_length_22253_cov_14.954455_13_plen_94_part_00
MRLFCQIPSIDIALISLLKSCMEYRCIYSTLIKLLGSFPGGPLLLLLLIPARARHLLHAAAWPAAAQRARADGRPAVITADGRAAASLPPPRP